MEKKILPIGSTIFRSIIENNYYYVDKTLFIEELLKEAESSAVLFTRPRRFGKTLNCQMIKTFFELETDQEGNILPIEARQNPKLFHNLKIWENIEARKEQGKYPTIFLTLKEVNGSNWISMSQKFRTIFSNLYKEYLFLEDSKELDRSSKLYFRQVIDKKLGPDDLEESLFNLSVWLKQRLKQEVIIIIDEYDNVFNEAYINGSLEDSSKIFNKYFYKIRTFMSNLMGFALKDNHNLRLGIVTGIMRIAKESIFSKLNSLLISDLFSDEYCQYFGFTEKEVEELAK
jgi:hypothetical protein